MSKAHSRPTNSPPTAPEVAAKPRTGDEFSNGRVRGWMMQQSLASLLDRVRGTRQVLPHLAALEVTLGKRGSDAIAQIPPHHLTRICQQLTNLPLPKKDAGLHELLGLLLNTLEVHDQAQQQTKDPHAQFLSTFVSDSRLEVSEGSLADFDAAAAGKV
jgi:hypothetical protein